MDLWQLLSQVNGGVPAVESLWSVFERFGPAAAVIAALIAAAKWFAVRFDKLTDRHFSYLDKTTEIAEGTREMVSSLATETRETKDVSQRIALSQNETSRALRGVRRSLEAQTNEIKKIPDAVHQEGRATIEAIQRSSEAHVKNILEAVNHVQRATEKPKEEKP